MQRTIAAAVRVPSFHRVRPFSGITSPKPRDGSFTLYLSCLPGLEPVLSKELRTLDIPHSIDYRGGVNIRQAPLDTITKCHLFLGSASHVFLRCGRAFEAVKFGELTRKVSRIRCWQQWLRDDAVPQIRVKCSKSRIRHTFAAAESVERGIDKALGRPPQSADGPVVPILVRIDRDIVQISIDTSQTPMHQRGYRLETGKAPLREDIAYSMLYAAGWTSTYNHGLIDPLCGSGTIAIEGAAMKVGLSPGRLRDAPLEGTYLYNPDSWADQLTESLERASKKAASFESENRLIVAGDRDEGVIKSATSNAERAGVLEFMNISACSISDHEWFKNPKSAPESVLIATNPPYGRRVIASRQKTKKRFDELLPLYQTIGQKVKGMKDVDVGVVALVNNVDLARRMAIPDTKALFSTKHGGLPVAAMGAKLRDAEEYFLKSYPETDESVAS